MSKVRFSRWQVGAMVALPVAIILNPLTLEIYLDVVKQVLEGISFVAAAYFVAFALYKVLKPEQTHIPKKTDKTSKGGQKYE